ncbi:MAG: C10 family peptidase [Bacteroidales bacterium]|nr:C10 family peptidase [Bacteroidales bacterium]
MKRIFTSVVLLLTAICAFAKVVTPEQARQKAEAFFAGNIPTKSAAPSLRLSLTWPESVTKAPVSAPDLYVFERDGGGFVVVSGDDAARSVLGWSLDGSFPSGDMPENLKKLLDWYSQIIEYARARGWSSMPMAAPELDTSATVQLFTAPWSQDSPFNDLAKPVEGIMPPIGCVATAQAIIMQYHRWPSHGYGALPSYYYFYNGSRYNVEGFSIGHPFDWDLMPAKSSGFTEEESRQIARLLYDLAVMSQMEFAPEGSGASGKSPMKLPQYFNYDKGIAYYEREMSLNDRQWEQLIKDDIDANRPVFYVGYDGEDGGHAFVLDGYNDRWFSINFGWGGGRSSRPGHDNNSPFKGFYTLTPIEGHEEDLSVFNSWQAMTCRIQPDRGTEPKPEIHTYDIYRGLSWDFTPGGTFVLTGGFILNYTLAYADTRFCFALFDRDGIFKEQISAERQITISPDSYTYVYGMMCTISEPPEEGDFIAPAIFDAETETWKASAGVRRGLIVFTRRPLRNLVKLGYREGVEHDIVLDIYKDVSWAIFRERAEYPLVSSASFDNESVMQDQNYLFESLDEETGMARFSFKLSTGTYYLVLRNNGEEMKVELVL